MPLRFELVTPERLVRADDVHMVVVPGTDGDFGVLEGHAPFMSTMRNGELSIHRTAGGEVERIALEDEYFVSRKLYPNVDFYTGLIYRAMGFPTRMFTVLFALGRLPGWIAQWREMINDPATKIGRPRQVYTGPALRSLDR